MKPIKEVKTTNLRILFYEYDKEHPITYKAFAERLDERADVMGKYLSGIIEISDEKIVKWCRITSKPFSFFYDEHSTPPWPPQKKSYRLMTPDERLMLTAESYVEYHPGIKKLGKITVFLKMVSDELQRVLPPDVLVQNSLLRNFVETFKSP